MLSFITGKGTFLTINIKGAVQGPPDSDSLGGTNYPYRGGKWTNWEGGVRVPAFVVGPGISKNVTSDALFHITDWLPTLAKIANVKPKKELDGVDQTGLQNLPFLLF